MNPLIYLIHNILQLASFALFIYIVLLILIHLNVLTMRMPAVAKTTEVLEAVFGTALKKIRGYVPPVRGIDFSPLVLSIAIGFVDYALVYYLG